MGHRSGLTSFRGESRAGFRGLEHSCPLSCRKLRSDAPDASRLLSAARTGGGRSGSFRGVKTVLLIRREKRGESELRVSPYLLPVSHTGRCTLNRSRLLALIEFLRYEKKKQLRRVHGAMSPDLTLRVHGRAFDLSVKTCMRSFR